MAGNEGVGRLAVLEVETAPNVWHPLSGEGTGFTGFDVSVLETERPTPGAGRMRHRLTGHEEGTASFTVDDAETPAVQYLRTRNARPVRLRWSPNGVSATSGFEIVSAIAEVTSTAEPQGVWVHAITGQVRVAIESGAHAQLQESKSKTKAKK